jgi:hypothetical protein
MAELVSIPSPNRLKAHIIMVCGSLRTQSAVAHRKLMDLAKSSMTAPLGGRSRGPFVDVFSNQRLKNHLHVNLVADGYYRKRPKQNATVAEVQGVLSGFVGIELDVDLTGRFLRNLADLPQDGLVEKYPLEVRRGPVVVRQTAQRLAIEGGSVDTVSWSFVDEKSVRIELNASYVQELDADYLAVAEQLLSQGLEELGFAGEENADSKD